MSDEPWVGPPKWNGKQAKVCLTGCLLPWHSIMGPVLVQIDNCKDFFCPVFEKEDDLHQHMEHLFSRGLPRIVYGIKQVDDGEIFLESMQECNIRVMLEPQIINDDHTKWFEVVKDGEQWKFADSTIN